MLKRREGKERLDGRITGLDDLLPIERRFFFDEASGSDPDDFAEPWGMIWSLQRGDDTFRLGRPTTAELWAMVGDEVVAQWAILHPGSRPRCWWRYDAPDDDFHAGESELDYLRRHNLLLPHEARLLGERVLIGR